MHIKLNNCKPVLKQKIFNFEFTVRKRRRLITATKIKETRSMQ